MFSDSNPDSDNLSGAAAAQQQRSPRLVRFEPATTIQSSGDATRADSGREEAVCNCSPLTHSALYLFREDDGPMICH